LLAGYSRSAAPPYITSPFPHRSASPNTLDTTHGRAFYPAGLLQVNLRQTLLSDIHVRFANNTPPRGYSTMSMSAEQAAAQAAVAAASTPQPQQGTPQQSAATPVAGGSADSLTCQWQTCGERCPSAEQLYVSLLTPCIARRAITALYRRGCPCSCRLSWRHLIFSRTSLMAFRTTSVSAMSAARAQTT
jgi:hypothetical protein